MKELEKVLTYLKEEKAGNLEDIKQTITKEFDNLNDYNVITPKNNPSVKNVETGKKYISITLKDTPGTKNERYQKKFDDKEKDVNYAETDSVEEAWAEKAFRGYLNKNLEKLNEYDIDKDYLNNIQYKKGNKKSLGIKSIGGKDLDIDIYLPYTEKLKTARHGREGLCIAIDGIDHSKTFTNSVYRNDQKRNAGNYDLLRINIEKNDIPGEREFINKEITKFCDAVFGIYDDIGKQRKSEIIKNSHQAENFLRNKLNKNMIERLINSLAEKNINYVRDEQKFQELKEKYKNSTRPEELVAFMTKNVKLSDFLKTKEGKRSYYKKPEVWAELAGRDISDRKITEEEGKNFANIKTKKNRI